MAVAEKTLDLSIINWTATIVELIMNNRFSNGTCQRQLYCPWPISSRLYEKRRFTYSPTENYAEIDDCSECENCKLEIT